MDNELIYSVTGIIATLEIYDDKIIISKNGLTKNIDKGDMTLYYKNIIALDYKKPTSINRGYLRFVLPGSDVKKSLADVINDDNTIVFAKKEDDIIQKIITYVESKLGNNTIHSISVADELLKFKQLLDADALTQEEYDIKKDELLNLNKPEFKMTEDDNPKQSNPPESIELNHAKFKEDIKPKKKGKPVLAVIIFAFILFFVFKSMNGIILSTSSNSSSTNEVPPLVNIELIHNMNLNQLTETFGELKFDTTMNTLGSYGDDTGQGIIVDVYNTLDYKYTFYLRKDTGTLYYLAITIPEAEQFKIKSVDDILTSLNLKKGKNITQNKNGVTRFYNVDDTNIVKELYTYGDSAVYPQKVSIVQLFFEER
ncbi:hypothetical protein SAMN02745245_01930 [Anaerosphaera aminiphila DSM 21120]|uniref:SHOCT domain-containing protein n=1 Tax=Anaerosphaera aminiphila DSM 21120 TaxID=1120995 RepID=A0A1M5UZK6_9FIRM|nr:SHOCT domain-containing protein [Anaerosphaera aminiphila]SHH68421.1 hypothetical protein SAMN02745245_01930 [Anaerosphaera aminiphila DSM 21120]